MSKAFACYWIRSRRPVGVPVCGVDTCLQSRTSGGFREIRSMSDPLISGHAPRVLSPTTVPPVRGPATQTPTVAQEASSPSLEYLRQAQSDVEALRSVPGDDAPSLAEPQQRTQVLQQLTQQAQQGDRAALNRLLGMLAARSHEIEQIPYSSRNDFLRQVVDAVFLAREHFQPADYAGLVQALDNFSLRDLLKAKLREAHQQGDSGVLTGLRQALGDERAPDGARYEAAQLLAGLDIELTDQDYTRLLGVALSTVLTESDSPVWQRLKQASEEGNNAVLQALQSNLDLEPSEYGNDRRLERSLLLLDQNPEFQAPPALIGRLVGLVRQGGYEGDKAAALLGRAIHASARPEEYREHAHLVLAQRFLDEDVRATMIRLAGQHAQDGGEGPLSWVRSILGPDSEAHYTEEHRALGVYREAIQSLKLEDLEVLQHLLTRRPGSSYLGAEKKDAADLLVQAAEHLEGELLDRVRQILREALASPDRETRYQASRAMGQLSHLLRLEDLQALATSSELGAGESVLKGLPGLSLEDKGSLLASLRPMLGSDNYQERERALKLMAHLGEAMTGQDVELLSSLSANPLRQAALAAALKAGEATTREQAALLLIQGGRNSLDDATLQELSKVAAASNHPRLREAVSGLLRNPPLNEDNLAALGEAFQRRFAQRIRNARPGSVFAELGRLFLAAQMAQDPESGYAHRIDRDRVNARIAELQATPEFRRAVEDDRRQAIRETMPHLIDSSQPGGVRDPGAAQADYLLSADFEARLRLATPEERERIVQSELGRLAGIDPEKAQRVQQALALRTASEAAKERPLEFLVSLPAPERAKVLEQLLTLSGMTEKAAEVASRLSQALEALDEAALQGGSGSTTLVRLLEGLRGTPGVPDSALQRAVQGIQQLDRRGAFGSTVGALSLASIFMRGVPQDAESAARTGAEIMDVAGNFNSYAKLLGASDDMLRAGGRLAGISRVARILGPVGTVASSVLDGIGAYRDLRDGDYVGGIAKGVSAGAGVAGLAALAFMSGPAMPVVVGVALVVGIGAALVDWIFGESEEETMLRQLGVLTS